MAETLKEVVGYGFIVRLSGLLANPDQGDMANILLIIPFVQG
jgi:hypothetical protein